VCLTSQAAHATDMKHDAKRPSASAEGASGRDDVEEDPCFWRKQEAWDPLPSAEDLSHCHPAPGQEERQPQ
jgi:hypothetical protein